MGVRKIYKFVFLRGYIRFFRSWDHFSIAFHYFVRLLSDWQIVLNPQVGWERKRTKVSVCNVAIFRWCIFRWCIHSLQQLSTSTHGAFRGYRYADNIILESAGYISTYCPIQASKYSLQIIVSVCQVKLHWNLLFRVLPIDEVAQKSFQHLRWVITTILYDPLLKSWHQ